MKRGARKAAAAARQPVPAPVVIPEVSEPRMVEVCRSFSYKLNAGHYDPARQYESYDFFASQKVHCQPDEAMDASLAAYAFCKRQVLTAANEQIAELRASKAERANGSGPAWSSGEGRGYSK